MSNLIHPQQSILESDRCRSITSMYPIHFGGDAGLCPRVHNAFATKELQQYRYYTTQLFIGQPLSIVVSKLQYLDNGPAQIHIVGQIRMPQNLTLPA